MQSFRALAVAATAFMLCSTSSAAPRSSQSESYHSNEWKRQDPKQPDVDYLEPVVPPEVDESLLSLLAPKASIGLTWAGSGASSSPSATKRRVMKRDGAVFARAALEFKWPAIALDHSAHISSVSCSNGQLSGVLDEKAYQYAKQRWSGARDLIFITAADTCGEADWNDYFHSVSVVFTDAGRHFTATQTSTKDRGLVNAFKIDYGAIGTQRVKRAITKRDMFESHLVRRVDFGPEYVSWDKYLHNKEYFGTAEDAPWENAALLKEWKKGQPNMKEDNSYKKGEVASKDGHHKRSNETSLAVRGTSEKEFDYGVALYCVDCGTKGNFVLSGKIEGGWSGVTQCSMRLNGNMQAGLNLGLNAYVKYSNDWTSEQKKVNIYSIGIEGLATIKPYIGIALTAGYGFEASGQVLLGATALWDNIDFQVDVANRDNTFAKGLQPRFEKRAEAKGELEVTAYLGLPIELGLGVQVGGILDWGLIDLSWNAAAGVRDTPKINFKGGFEASAELTKEGKVEYDINGGCYGLAWNVFFSNDLDFFARADYFGEYTKPIVEPYQSDPIAQGCIGYVKDGSDDGIPDGQVEGTGTGSGLVGNGMNSGSNGFAGSFGGFNQGLGQTTQSSSTTTSTSTSTSTSSAAVGGSPQGVAAAAQSSSTTTTTSSRTTSGSTTRASTTSSSTTPRSTTRSSSTTSRSTTRSSATTTRPSTTTARTTTTTTKAACTPSPLVNTAAPTTLTCKKAINRAVVMTSNKPAIGNPVSLATVDLCAGSCLKDTKCLSFSYTDKKMCQLYNVAYKSLLTGTTSNTAAPQLTFFDRQCYVNSTCPK